MSSLPDTSDLPLGRGVTLLHVDARGVLAFAKPAGLLSHPNELGDEPRSALQARYDLESEAYTWEGSLGGPIRRCWLLNRIDSATSGVLLGCLREDLAVEIRAQFRRKQVRKVYFALVFGAPRAPLELWRDLLAVERREGRLRTSARAGNIPAECRMSVARRGLREPRLTLLRLEPRTGRSHQLRVQCAQRGLPIVGDQTYGDFPRNREFARSGGSRRLFLHAAETSFEYQWEGAPHAFAARAPVPPEFEQAL